MPPSHSWYHWKALNEQGSKEVVFGEMFRPTVPAIEY